MEEVVDKDNSIAFILKYINLGTISSAEVPKYERSKKRILNVSLGMIIGAENIHYNVLYTEEDIVYNSISWGKVKSDTIYKDNNKDLKKDRKSTIAEKIEFISNTIEEFNKYYSKDTNFIILTTFDEDIKSIAKKIDRISFEIVDKNNFNYIIENNEIDNDVFYKKASDFDKKEFKSMKDVMNKVNNMINFEN